MSIETSLKPDLEDKLPDQLPIMPLSGVILLPGNSLPLNIFEPRYLSMVEDALAGRQYIGIIQPQTLISDSDIIQHHTQSQDDVQTTCPLYGVGSLGLIDDVHQGDDGRYLISLKGITRFKLGVELDSNTLYRQIRPLWQPYLHDFNTHSHDYVYDHNIARIKLMELLRLYLDRQSLHADYEAISQSSDNLLINTLSMILPFDEAEKQALLQAHSLAERAKILIALLAMALHDSNITGLGDDHLIH